MNSRNQKRRSLAQNQQRRSLLHHVLDLFRSPESMGSAKPGTRRRPSSVERLEGRSLLTVMDGEFPSSYGSPADNPAPYDNPGTGEVMQMRLSDLATARPIIVAGWPNPGPPFFTTPDNPSNRVDANNIFSPFSGVGSLNINGGGICTATPISTRHILTAAHCVDLNADGVIDMNPFISSFILNYSGNSSSVIGIESVNMHPDYTGFNNPSINDDIAVLTLTSPLPAGVPIYALNTDPLVANTNFTSVGYGLSGDAQFGYYIGPSFATKRVGSNTASLVGGDDEGTGSPEFFAFDFDSPTFNIGDFDGLPGLGNLTETTFGGGDSGGPSFIPDGLGGYKIFGVDTFIFGNAPLFGSGGGGMLVSTYASYIQAVTGNINANLDPASGNQADDGIADEFYIVRNATNPNQIDIFVNGNLANKLLNPRSIIIDGSSDDDVLIVDSSNGLLNLPGGIRFFGGAGRDVLQTVDFNLRASETISPGAAPGQGYSNIDGQSIYFEGIEPILSNVPAVTFTLSATPLLASLLDANNSINYSTSASFGPAVGRLTVDNFEPIEFVNKTNVVIDAGAGSDTINLNNPNTPTGLASITVNGGDPTASDTVIVNGTAASNAISVSGITRDGATIIGAQPVPVTVTTAEHLTIVGQGGNDSLTVTSPALGSEISFTPGATADSGGVTHVGFLTNTTLLPLDYTTLGQAGSLTFDVSGGGRASGLDIHGTNSDDQFNVTSLTGTVQIVKPTFALPVTVPINTTGVVFLRLDGQDGDDIFNIPLNHPITLGIDVQGGDPSGSDVANVTGDGSAVNVTLGNPAAPPVSPTSITGGGGTGTITLPGVENINLAAGTGTVNVRGTSGPDDFLVTPTNPNQATLQLANSNVVLNTTFSPGAGILNVDGISNVPANGRDTLTVKGNANAQIYTVTGTMVQAGTFKTVNYVNFEALTVTGEEGNDTFNVTPAAIPIHIDGGDPIGALPGDSLSLNAFIASYNLGPASDEGSLVALGAEPVSFRGIETLAPITAALFTITGTNGPDAITVIQTGDQDFTVAVNAGPTLTFIDTPLLFINSLGGDDSIAVQTDSALGPWNVFVAIDAGQPTASDTVVVGSAGNDTVQFAPISANGGLLSIVNLNAVINLANVEHLKYDGQAGNDSLSVLGQAGVAELFTHTPGVTADSGSVAIDSLLPINYSNLGAGASLTLDGQDLLVDQFVALGTDANDSMGLSYNGASNVVSLVTGGSTHTPITVPNFASLTLAGLAGNDQFVISPNVTTPVTVEGGDSSSSDVLLIDESSAPIFNAQFLVSPLFGNNLPDTGSVYETISGLNLNYTGIETLQLLGTGDDDVEIRDDLGDNTWTLRRGPAIVLEASQVQIDDRSPISIEGFDLVRMVNDSGVDRFIVSPDRLPAIALYQAVGLSSGADYRSTFEVLGTGQSDNPITLSNTAVTLGTTVEYSQMAAVVVKTGEGDDTLEIDASVAFVSTPVFFDGGTGNDVLRVAGSGATPVDELIYNPGPAVNEGSLRYENAANVLVMQIDFANLEPVLDNTNAVTVTVNGTGANNAISYSAGPGGVFFGGNPTGLVAVDGFETLEFNNKTNLVLNGGAGDDVISLNNATTPFGLTGTITVNGGDPTASDTVIVNGTTGADTINFTATGIESGTVAVNALPLVTMATVEHVTIVGRGGDDQLTVTTPLGNDLVTLSPAGTNGGEGEITIADFGDTPLLSMNYREFDANSELTLADASGGRGDRLALRGTNRDDRFTVASNGDIQVTDPISSEFFSLLTHTPGGTRLRLVGLDGDDEFNVVGNHPFPAGIYIEGGNPSASDTVNFNATGANLVTVDAQNGTVGEATFANVTLSGIEQLNVDANFASVNVRGTAGNDVGVYSPFTATSGRITELVSNTTLDMTDVRTLTIDGVGGQDSLTVNGTTANDAFTNVSDTSVAITGLLGATLANIGAGDAIHAVGGAGNDSFVVPAGNLAAVTISGGGPAGSDSLQMDEATFSVVAGASVDAGRVNTTNFDGIESLILNSSGVGVATINGTDGNDAVTATGGAGGGFVASSFGPAITLQNFTAGSTLNLSTGAGTDAIQVNQVGTWVFGIIGIDGGDPWAADSVAIRGDNAVDETFDYTSTSENSAVLVLTSGTVTGYTLTNISSVDLDAEGLAGDALTVTNANAQILPGFAPGSGLVNTFSASGAALLGVSYSDFESATITATTVVVDGTAGDDTIGVAVTGVVTVTNTLGYNNSVTLSGSPRLILNTLGGNDDITISAGAPFSAIDVIGGEPGAGSDTLTVESPAAWLPVLDLSAVVDTLLGVIGGPIGLHGIETLNLVSTTDGTTDQLVVIGYGDPSDLATINFNAGDLGLNDGDGLLIIDSVTSNAVGFEPKSPSEAIITNSHGPQINVSNFNNVPGSLLILGGGNEEITFQGSAAADTINVNGNLNQVQLTPTAGPPAWVGLTFGGQVSLVVNAAAGSDTINVTSPFIPIHVDGGDPIGFSDILNVNAAGNAVSVQAGPESDEGAVLVATFEPISYNHIEGVTVTGAAATTVIGTPGDDDITAEGGPTTADVVVYANGLTPITFLAPASVTLDGRQGDDDITVNPFSGVTPITVPITVIGGSPTFDPLVDGDRLTVEGTPNADVATIDLAAGTILFVGGQPITFGTIERLALDVQGNGDIVNVTGADNYVYTPGEIPGQATLTADEMPISLAGLDGGEVLNVIGGAQNVSFLTVNGTDADDVFNVLPGTGAVVANNSPTIVPTSIEALTLVGRDGADQFVVFAPVPEYALGINLQGGSTDGDVALIFGDSVSPMSVNFGFVAGNVSVAGGGIAGTVQTTDMEDVAVQAGNQAIALLGTSFDDVLSVTPLDGTTGVAHANGVAPLVAYTTTGVVAANLGGGNDRLTFNGSAGPDVIIANAVTLTVAGRIPLTYSAVDAESLLINGGAGDDQIDIDNSLGLVNVLSGVEVDGGTGGDLLRLIGSTPVLSSTYTPGPTNDAGVVVHSSALAVQTVRFTNFEPVIDIVVAGTLTVVGTNGDDAITYTAGPNSGGALVAGLTSGQVAVNAFETIEFANKTNLILQGRAGADTITIDNGTVPTNLASITVDGGASGNDVVVVYGTAANETITYRPTGATTGDIAVTGLPLVSFVGVESAEIDGGNGFGDDDLFIDTSALDGLQVLTPGTTSDSGRVDFQTGGFVASHGAPVSFRRLGSAGSVTFFDAGRFDNLLYHGTGGDDTFSVDSAGQVLLNSQIAVNTPAIITLTLSGGNGDDTFNIDGDHNLPAITVEGGSPSASDIINFLGSGTGAIIVDLLVQFVQEIGFGPVNYTGIETINASAAGLALTVAATNNDDTLRVTPLGANAGTLQANGLSPVVNYSNVAANTVNVDLRLGQDTLIVNGTSAADNFTVNVPTSTVDTGANGGLVVYVGNESLEVNGLAGGDTFAVTPGAQPVKVFGGDPIGATGDVLNLTATGAVTFFPGPQGDQGAFSIVGSQPVSYTEIEDANVNLAGNALTAQATNGDDDITVVGLGLASFDLSINAGPAITYTNAISLAIDALAGDDDIDVEQGVAGFVVPITVTGGASSTSGGDIITLTGLAGADAFTYAPTGIGTGTASIAGGTSVTFNTAEQVAINGLGGTDSLNHATLAGVNQVTYTPGSASDAGTIATRVAGAGAALVPLNFSQLGAGGSVSFTSAGGREDVLELNGTDNSDIFNVNQVGDQIQIVRPTGAFITVDLNTAGINILDLRGLDGDDTFNLAAVLPYAGGVLVDGGNPSASDTLNLTGATGAIVENLAAQTVTGYGATVSFLGVEHVNLAGSGGAATLTINASTGDDQLAYTPTGAAAGTVTRAGQNVVTNFSGIAGTFTLDALAGSDTVTVNGTSLGDAITVNRAATTTVQVNGLKTVELPSANTDSLVVSAGSGNDTVTVSGTSGPAFLNVVGGDSTSSGGAGDRLVVNAATGTTTVSPGSTPDAGVVDAPAGNPADDVGFSGMEFLTINGTAAVGDTLVVQGTHDNDTLAVQNLGGNNLVWVNDRAVVTFTNYPTITLSGRFGDDKINVTPTGLVGVTTVNAQGGDPTASDEVVVNGTSGTDNVTIDTLVLDGARVTGLGGVTVNVSTAEELVYSGLGGNDILSVTTPAGPQLVDFSAGAVADAGSVLVSQGGGNSLLPIAYQGMGIGGTITLADAGAARTDLLNFNGTSSDDLFLVTAVTGDLQITDAGSTAFRTLRVQTPGIAQATLRGFSGDDVFNVPGDHPFTNSFGLAAVRVEGGDPSASDVLNFAGSGAGAVTVDLGAATVVEAGFGTVAYTSVETINASTSGVNNPSININDAAGDDDIIVTVLNANQGSVVANGVAPTVNYTNVGGAPVNFPFTAGGEDTLRIVGNALTQTISANANALAVPLTPPQVPVAFVLPGRTAVVDDLNDGTANGQVTWTATLEALEVFGNQGNDTFNIVPGLIPVFVDGGDPIAIIPGDTINIVAAVPSPITFQVGPESDEGGFKVGANEIVSFDHIESIGALNAICAIIIGTNADDDITVIARDASTHVGADGVQDFTTSVNAGPDILWYDTPELHIDGMNGDDHIVIRTPAPNLAAWNVIVNVAGGPPSAPLDGDRLEVETPGQDTTTYTPTGSDTGILNIINANGQVAIINIGPFTVDCDGDEINEYVSSPGGIEDLWLDGEGANDSLTIIGTVNSDLITHTPGAGRDEGSLRVNEMLAISYQNLGLGASLTVNGGAGGRADTLIAKGTGGSDTMTASRESAAIGTVAVNSQLVLRTDSIEIYTLDALEGNDRFIVVSPLADAVGTVNTLGGGPGGSDVLEVLGQFGVADTVSVTPGETRTDGLVEVDALDVNYTGVEHLQINAGDDVGDALFVRATSNLGDNLWTVNAGDYSGDRVQIDNRETIEFQGFDTVELINQFGTDLFRVYPSSMTQYNSLIIIGDAGVPEPIDDVLEVYGTPAADTVTSDATTITLNGKNVSVGGNLIEVRVNTLAGDDQITLGLNLAGTRKVVDGGDGNDTINVSAMLDATIYGGAGDDHITGSPIADLIYGGSGNDVIFGLGGDDTVYGDEGNDTITGGTGNDNLFGGDGSDRFIWNNGDNSDVVEGDEGVDVQVVNGAAAGDAFLLRTKTGDESRAFFERTNLVPFSIDMGKVEQVDINSGDGADTIEVRDLYTTDVTDVNINVGIDAQVDAVTIHGRNVTDNVTLSFYNLLNAVNVAGMKYDVNVAALDPANDLDTLTFNANDGDDTVVAQDNLSNIFGGVFAQVNRLIVNGGLGDDTLSGFGNLNGNEGDDLLLGGSFGQLITGGDGNDELRGGGGDDTLNGNAGEDLFVGDAGNDTIIGGDVPGVIEWDTILVSGTSSADTIDINQTLPTSLTHRVNTNTQIDTLGLLADGTRTVDEVRVEAGAGADLIRVKTADAAVLSMATDGVFNHLVTVVHGGSATGAGDRLVMIDDGDDDLMLYRKGQDVTEGNVTIGPANAEPYETVFDGIERVQFLNETGVAINQDPAGATSRLVMFETDLHEYNDDRFLATILGAPLTTTLGATIDPGAILDPFGDGMNIPGDEDWFKVQANVTGTLDFQSMFEEIGNIVSSGRPGLPGNGDLDIYVYDIDGTLIAGSGGTFGGNNGSGLNPELDVDGDVFAENERVRIPAVAGQSYIVRVIGRAAAGNPTTLTGTINAFTLNVINVPAPTPFDLELQDNPVSGVTNPPGTNGNSDTGRNQFDNHTYDNTPTIIFRLDDGLLLNDLPGNDTSTLPPDEITSIPFRPGVGVNGTQPTLSGYAIAIFDEGSTAPAAGNAGGTNIRQPLGFATQLEPGLYTFTVPAGMALNDGSHFITARVLMIDPAIPQQFGWGARSDSFEIVVDRVAPPVFFGYVNLADNTQGLSASSDSGNVGYPATFTDRATNDTTPSFYGTGEADSVVRLYVETNGVAGLQSRESGAANPDLFIGLTTAVPLDGSNQFPGGNWELNSHIDLNNPALGFTKDGVRIVYVTAEDLAGNITTDADADRLAIFLDTQGPQVVDVDINSRNNPYDLFDPKPSTDGPTPLVYTLVIDVRDLPIRQADGMFPYSFLYPALQTEIALTPGIYSLVGDHNGIIPIQSITYTQDPLVSGQIATGFVTLTFFEPLPDDRFTLTIDDELSDPVGNRLDGESNADEPQENPTFPSGDGVPGTDFVARFTIDSRAEIGSWISGAAYVDTNGNFTFDPENPDFTNRDIQYKVHFPEVGPVTDQFYTTDEVFAGKFTKVGAVTNDRFDRLGAYGLVGSEYRWLIDTDNNGVADLRVVDPARINGFPVAGNFDGNLANGDEVGLFTGTTWWLDKVGHDYKVDTSYPSSVKGYPIVGDFDGDGLDDLGVWSDDKFSFDFASNGFGSIDDTISFGFLGVRERPVAADMDGDGVDDIGLWVPDRAGQPLSEQAEWYFLTSNLVLLTPAQRTAATTAALGTANLLNHPFKPKPFGKDLYAIYGDDYALPLIGNFDPPVTASSGGGSGGTNLLDVNKDGSVSPIDALLVINYLNGPAGEAAAASSGFSMDVNGDGSIAPIDALLVINYLNAQPGGEGEGADDVSVQEPAARVAMAPVSAGSVVTPVAGDASAQPNVQSDDEDSVAAAFADAVSLVGDAATDELFGLLASDQDEDENEAAHDWLFGQL